MAKKKNHLEEFDRKMYRDGFYHYPINWKQNSSNKCDEPKPSALLLIGILIGIFLLRILYLI